MPDLLHTLQGRDLGFLRMTASLWGIELAAPDVHTALPLLTQKILSSGQIQEMVDTLPEVARQAMHALLENDGLMPWSLFSRRYGEIRVMGSAKRDRERPDLRPASPSEALWYRGLIGRAFLNQPPEPQEYTYIPDDLIERIHIPAAETLHIYGRPASPAEIGLIQPATDGLLDHICTFLAGRRMGLPDSTYQTQVWGISLAEMEALLLTIGLLDKNGKPQPRAVQSFLKTPRAAALMQLVTAWVHSTTYNELLLLPELTCEGDWMNDPLSTRSTVLDMLSHLPQHTWWNCSAFLADVKEYQPDFQRPAGDYDSWFIRKTGTEQYYRGFSAWDEVDGRLLLNMITRPLHWLGIYDLASLNAEGPPDAFRPSDWAEDLLSGNAPQGFPEEDGKIRVTSEGTLYVPRLAPRALRYQLARFTDWIKETAEGYTYRVTPAALERARQQNLSAAQLINLLRKNFPSPLPPTLIKALNRWEKQGSQAKIQPAVLLRVTSAEVLTALRGTRAARFLLEELSPTIVTLRPGSEEAVLAALAEIGYLGEGQVKADV